VGDEREAEMLRQVIVAPEERLVLNLRNVTHGTKSRDDSVLLAAFRSGMGSGLGAISQGIGISGQLHLHNSMTKEPNVS
jgi:hypothetical protein